MGLRVDRLYTNISVTNAMVGMLKEHNMEGRGFVLNFEVRGKYYAVHLLRWIDKFELNEDGQWN